MLTSRCRPLSPPIVIHHRYRRRCRCRQATTTTTATTVVEFTVIHCQRKRQQQHHCQHTNGSTNVKTFTSPVDLDLFNLSTVFEVCDVVRGNLAISKLLALKKFGPFLRSTYYWMSRSTFLGGGARSLGTRPLGLLLCPAISGGHDILLGDRFRTKLSYIPPLLPASVELGCKKT
jgi:hypothetical protein